ncbi:MAG: hypothetical protein HUJ89_01715 [Bacteroidales bacterium]|nr:hypothetical protein [Bacteroidales bacterium]
MQFSKVIGNEGLKDRLARAIDAGRMPHAVILSEEDGNGAVPLAVATAQYLSCPNRSGGDSCGVCPVCNRISKMIHPDLHFIFPVNASSKSGSDKKPTSEMFISEWNSLVLSNPLFRESELYEQIGIEDKVGTISVAQARSMLSTLNMRSYEGGNKYMIVYLPERMTTEAANALLKMVEEPYPGTYFIFITHSGEKVIQTISSRCMSFSLEPLSLERTADLNKQWRELFFEQMNLASSRNLEGLMSLNDALVDLGRERQKQYFLYSVAMLRAWLMMREGLPQLAGVSPQEAEHLELLRKIFPARSGAIEKMSLAFDDAREKIASNVNAKMVMLHLSNTLFRIAATVLK